MSDIKGVARPNLEFYKKLAKTFFADAQSGDESARKRLLSHRTDAKPTLTLAQLAIARDQGFPNWSKFKAYIDTRSMDFREKVDEFIRQAAWGDAGRAMDILRDEPAIAHANLYTALILGDYNAVQAIIDTVDVNAAGGPSHWQPLLYVCFSRLGDIDPALKPKLAETGLLLLGRGADPNVGFRTTGQNPEFESALYGASSVSRNAELTKLLISLGASVDDEEVAYHICESYDLSALQVVVEQGRPRAESLVTMLLRKADWHHLEGIRYLVEQGADVNGTGRWGRTALFQAILRDNSLEILEYLLDHGADPHLECLGLTSIALAARRGRGDFLDLCETRDVDLGLAGIDSVAAAVARGNEVETDNEMSRSLADTAGALLAEFAVNGNVEGLRRWLDIGLDANSRYAGDSYYNLAKNSSALHAAAWRLRHDAVELLVDRGASVNTVDERGRTPLMLAVLGCVESRWTTRRSPISAQKLLEAGASIDGVKYPSGYDEIDKLLNQYGAAE